VLHVHLADVLLERVELARDEVVDVRLAREVVRRREQESLEARRVLRAVPGRVEALEALARLHVVAGDALLLGQVGDRPAVVALGDRDLLDRAGARLLRRRRVRAPGREVVDGRGGRGDDADDHDDKGRGGDQPPAPRVPRAAARGSWGLARAEGRPGRTRGRTGRRLAARIVLR